MLAIHIHPSTYAAVIAKTADDIRSGAINYDDACDRLCGVAIPIADAAAMWGVRPSTIRRKVCVAGSYHGITPRKLPNGRLLIEGIDAARHLAGVA